MSHEINNIPVLVLSCDKYSDLWEPFFTIFFKRWPDCPFPVFLATNHLKFHHPKVSTIKIGDDLSWATGFLRAIGNFDSNRFILFLEDFLLRESVDTDRIFELAKFACEYDVGCLRFAAGLPLALPPSEPTQQCDGVGIIHKDELYRVSCQVALWKKETIKKLLVHGMTAWEFEEIGTTLSESIDDSFWAAYEPAVDYAQCVEKGKWKPEGIEICRKSDVHIDFKKRSAFSEQELLSYFESGAAKSAIALKKADALHKFIQKDRKNALKCILNCIELRRFDITLWTILFVGMLWPSLLKDLKKTHVRFKSRKIKKRFSCEQKRYACTLSGTSI